MNFVSVGICLACNHGGTLYDGRCERCRLPRPSNGQDDGPKVATPVTVARALDLLVAEMPAPLSARFTLASVAADLCRLAGEPVPLAVHAALGQRVRGVHALAETHRESAYDAA